MLILPAIVLPVVAVLPAAASDGTLETLPDGVRFTRDDGQTTQVQVWTDRTIHVTSQPKGAPEFRPSDVVIRKWEPVKFTLSQDDPAVFAIRTAELRVTLDRRTGAVSFFDPQGKPLLGEKEREFTPVTVNKEKTLQVQQTFGCAPDEAIFGLGQHQDGLWNWRGLPVELRQHNTSVAIPFLVSTKGYGLLWDNASRTMVNPVDQSIALTLVGPPATDDAGQPKATEDLGKAKQNSHPLVVNHGTFTTGAAGEYVFFAQNGDRWDEFSILVDGKPVAGVVNKWTPYTVTGTATLPARTTVEVTLRGGGKAPEVGARPRETGQTVFRSMVGDGVNYTFFYGPAMDQVIDDFRTATGTVPMLPRWAFGFWQCEERYSTQQEVLEAARKYRELKIPIDLIVQDWQYWSHDVWGEYKFEESRYPDPAGMIKELHDMNVKFMISVWPNPKGEAKAALQAIPHGFIGGSYYDAYNPEARRARWSVINKNLFSIGTDAWWQDGAEPGDGGTTVYGQETSRGSGDRDALAYPLFHTQGIYENQRATNPEKRVVNLTRSGYAGQQRYGAIVWSGDIRGDWITFKRQIAAGLNFSLSGQPYWTTDAGGFFRPPGQYTDVDYNEVQARWFEWSTFCPIQRIHGLHTKTEFWNWLPQTQKVLIGYDKLRYRLLPYNYSLAWQVTHRNSTSMRPLVMDFPNDPKAVATSDEYLWGPSFLVAPVTAKAISKEMYLPKGNAWIDFWTGKRTNGGTTINADAPLEKIPLQIRAGSIIPLGPDLQYAGEKATDPTELRVYPGAEGSFTLYEDEGDSYRYENGAFATIPMHWDDAGRRLVIGKREGSFPGMLEKRVFHVVIVSDNHGVGGDLTAQVDKVVNYDGAEVSIPVGPGRNP